MRVGEMGTLWAADEVVTTVDFEEQRTYTNLREVRANIQTDYSELDIQQYGKTVGELIKLRSTKPLDIKKGTHLYFTKPAEPIGPGAYVVESDKTALWGRVLYNPATVVAKRRT